MNEKQILDIIHYGLEGETKEVAKIAALVEKDLRTRAKIILADRIQKELDKERPVSQFNKDWWNCFSSFTEEVMTNGITGANMENACLEVLKGAGITLEEAENWLDSDEVNICPRTCEVVYRYCNSL